jgi:hypothetical protein
MATGNIDTEYVLRETLDVKGKRAFHISRFMLHDAHCAMRETMSIRSKGC